MSAMPPGHPVFKSSQEHVYDNVPFEVCSVCPRSLERRNSSKEGDNARSYTRTDVSSHASTSRSEPRSYYIRMSPKSRSITDIADARLSMMSPSPEPRSVVLDVGNRSRPLQKYYYPSTGKAEKTFHIAVPDPEENRKPLVSRSCPPIPTINVDQFYQRLDNNEYRSKSQTLSSSQTNLQRSPSLTQWPNMGLERCASQGSNKSTLSPSSPDISYLTVPQGRRSHQTSGGSSTSGSWPDLSEFANLPLTPAELEIHEVADALNSIGSERPYAESYPSRSASSLNDIGNTYMTSSDGEGSVRHVDSAGSCSNLSDTTASFVTGYESLEPQFYMLREHRPPSTMSGSYVNVDSSDTGPSRDRSRDEEDISNLLRTLEMLENRCTMFLDDWLVSALFFSSEGRSVAVYEYIVYHISKLRFG
ncbi:hypothetical protein BIW11_01707 [Tropilaelaps mercedesae]|uniref:Uncharacterized protein n=1 Tax=Tropilaelaps mercedesae TaxID=418985 RepID=A0A1V9XAD9_9ACAR|nr:hypothetical protein BIW11_01707 [Tropilaelaps mercedesae]